MNKVGVTLVILLFTVLGLGCKQAVVHNVSEQEANEIISVLQKYGVVAGKKIDNVETNTWSIEVPKQDATRSWSILQEHKLPRVNDRRFRDIFGQNKLIVTPVEERALFIEALQGEIAHTLESVDGVIDARVHLVIPEQDLMGKPTGTAKASVMVEYQPSSQGSTPFQPREVQQLVSHAVDGLEPDNVSVILKPAGLAPVVAGKNQNYELVNLGPLVIEKGSIPMFKLVFAVFLLIILFFGAIIYWQGRIINSLRVELKAAQRELRAIQKAGRPPQQAA